MFSYYRADILKLEIKYSSFKRTRIYINARHFKIINASSVAYLRLGQLKHYLIMR